MRISIVIPTYRREKLLIDTIRMLLDQVSADDEIIVVDQTPQHEQATLKALHELNDTGSITWYRKDKPSQAEALNFAATVATGDILLFLDDDIIPSSDFVNAHREALSVADPPPAVCGQVLQPWNEEPVRHCNDIGVAFDAAYDKPCEIVSLMAGNFSMLRDTYFQVGGMDENFKGSNYRNDAEMAKRIVARTGRKILFSPKAGLRHLLATGGNRAFGQKDTWGHIGGSVGDYYYALKWLSWTEALGHIVVRLFRAPLNRHTIKRPWKIISLAVREIMALAIAVFRLIVRRSNYVKNQSAYIDVARVPVRASSKLI